MQSRAATSLCTLAQQPPAESPTHLQRQLDQLRHIYNTQRPHRALGRTTPDQAYQARPKATPPGSPNPGHYRLRYDHVDNGGKVSIRRAGRMHHLGIGATHRGTAILAITDENTITVIIPTTGEILSAHHIEPNKTYWRNQQRSPGRWPGLP